MEWAFGSESVEKAMKLLPEKMTQITDYKVCRSSGPAPQNVQPKKVALKKVRPLVHVKIALPPLAAGANRRFLHSWKSPVLKHSLFAINAVYSFKLHIEMGRSKCVF